MSNKRLNDICISQKFESQEKKQFLLDHQFKYLKEVRSTVFQAVEFVAQQKHFDEELSLLLESLHAEVDSLEKTIEQGRLRSNELSSTIALKQCEIEDCRAKYQAYSSDKDRLLLHIEQLIGETLSLSDELSKENIRYLESVDQLSKIQAEHEKLQAQVHRNRILLDEKQQRIQANSIRISSIKRDHVKLSEELEASIGKIKQKNIEATDQVHQIAENERKLNELKCEIVAITHQLKNQESRNFQYTERLTEQGVKISNLCQENGRIEKQLNEMNRLIGQQAQYFERNELKISEQQKKQQDITRDYGQKQQQFLRNKNQIAEQEKRIQEKLKSLNLLEGQIAEQLNELNMQSISLRNNKNSIVLLKDKIANAEAVYTEKCRNVDQNRSELEQQKDFIFKAKGQLKKIVIDIDVLSVQHLSLESELNDVLVSSNEKKLIVEEQSKRLSFLHQQVETLSTLVKQTEIRVKQYDDQLAELSCHIDKKQALYNTLSAEAEKKRTSISNLSSEIQNKTRINSEISIKIEEVSLINSRLDLDLSRAHSHIADLDKEFYHLSNQLSLQSKMIDENQLANKQIEESCDPLKSDIDMLRSKLNFGATVLQSLIESNEKEKRRSYELSRSFQQHNASIKQLSGLIVDEQQKYESLRLYCEQTEELINEQKETHRRHQLRFDELLGQNHLLGKRKTIADEELIMCSQNILPMHQADNLSHLKIPLLSFFPADAKFTISTQEDSRISVIVKGIAISPQALKNIVRKISDQYPMYYFQKVSIADNQQKTILGIRFILSSKMLHPNDGQVVNALAA